MTEKLVAQGSARGGMVTCQIDTCISYVQENAQDDVWAYKQTYA